MAVALHRRQQIHHLLVHDRILQRRYSQQATATEAADVGQTLSQSSGAGLDSRPVAVVECLPQAQSSQARLRATARYRQSGHRGVGSPDGMEILLDVKVGDVHVGQVGVQRLPDLLQALGPPVVFLCGKALQLNQASLSRECRLKRCTLDAGRSFTFLSQATCSGAYGELDWATTGATKVHAKRPQIPCTRIL